MKLSAVAFLVIMVLGSSVAAQTLGDRLLYAVPKDRPLAPFVDRLKKSFRDSPLVVLVKVKVTEKKKHFYVVSVLKSKKRAPAVGSHITSWDNWSTPLVGSAITPDYAIIFFESYWFKPEHGEAVFLREKINPDTEIGVPFVRLLELIKEGANCCASTHCPHIAEGG